MAIEIPAKRQEATLPLHLDPEQPSNGWTVLTPKKPLGVLGTLKAIIIGPRAFFEESRKNQMQQDAAKNAALLELQKEFGSSAIAAFQRHGFHLKYKGLIGQQEQWLKSGGTPLTKRTYQEIEAELKQEFGNAVRDDLNKLGLEFKGSVIEGDFEVSRTWILPRPSDLLPEISAALEGVNKRLAHKRCDLMAEGRGFSPHGNSYDAARKLYRAAHDEVFALYRDLTQEAGEDTDVFHAIHAAVENVSNLYPLKVVLPRAAGL